MPWPQRPEARVHPDPRVVTRPGEGSAARTRPARWRLLRATTEAFALMSRPWAATGPGISPTGHTRTLSAGAGAFGRPGLAFLDEDSSTAESTSSKACPHRRHASPPRNRVTDGVPCAPNPTSSRACPAHGRQLRGAIRAFAYISRPRAAIARRDLAFRAQMPPTGANCAPPRGHSGTFPASRGRHPRKGDSAQPGSRASMPGRFRTTPKMMPITRIIR